MNSSTLNQLHTSAKRHCLRCEILGSSAHPTPTTLQHEITEPQDGPPAKGVSSMVPDLEISILRGFASFPCWNSGILSCWTQQKDTSPKANEKKQIHKLTNWSPSLNQVAMNYSATNSISATNNMVILLILSDTQAKVLVWLTTRVIVLLHGFHHMFGSRQDTSTRVKHHMAGRCGTWATQVLKLVGSNSLKLVGSSNSNYIYIIMIIEWYLKENSPGTKASENLTSYIKLTHHLKRS